MKGSDDKKLEYEALQEFIGLVVIDGNLGNRVRVALNEELTDRQRELINLYYLEQMSMTEIAHRLGLSPSTVSRTLKRGRGRLRKYLKYNGRYFMDSLSE
ncbi:MAG: sigma-70 family RNA polymerase sigma factor [Clostridiales bacterium]|nr:sigma-70 family RNA polymerase sigma factor [Clostridiales bacterium]